MDEDMFLESRLFPWLDDESMSDAAEYSGEYEPDEPWFYCDECGAGCDDDTSDCPECGHSLEKTP